MKLICCQSLHLGYCWVIDYEQLFHSQYSESVDHTLNGVAEFLFVWKRWSERCWTWITFLGRLVETFLKQCDVGADVVKSGIGFLVCSSILLAWALTFAYGGEELFGPSWKHLVVYDIADKYGQVRFITRPSLLLERYELMSFEMLLYSRLVQISSYMDHLHLFWLFSCSSSRLPGCEVCR